MRPHNTTPYRSQLRLNPFVLYRPWHNLFPELHVGLTEARDPCLGIVSTMDRLPCLVRSMCKTKHGANDLPYPDGLEEELA